METPKTKMQMVREYLAENPKAKAKDVAEAVGCCIGSVRLARNAERYERQKQRQKVYDRKKYLRHKEKIIAQHREYRAEHREEIKERKRRYYAATKRRVELQTWAKPVALAEQATEPTAKVRPIPDEARRFVRRQDALLKQMEHCTDSREAQRLMSEYSALQYRIEYKQTMANAADRHDAANHQCGVPMMFKVANGNGFSHH